MKAELITKNKKGLARTRIAGGFSLIEILIAIAVLTLSIGAVIMLVFANQTLKVDALTNNEAIAKAKELIETARANSRQDFNLVNPIPAATDDIYTKTLDVTMLDFWTKKIVSTVTWQADSRSLSINFSTIVTNPDGPGGGTTCNSALAGDWKNPQFMVYEFGKDLLGDSSSGFPISGIDVRDGKLYVVISNSNGNNFPTFFTFSLAIPDPTVSVPALLKQFDSDTTIKAGLNAIRVSGNFAYVAKATGPAHGQLQIIDISDIANPVVKSTFKVPGVTGTGSQALGNTIFYKDGYVYLGLTKTATGPEFNVIDVASSTAPVWKAGYSVGNDINSIYIKDYYAYIASPNTNDLIVTIVATSSWPNLPTIGSFDVSGGSNGKSVDVVGTTLYLGRTFGTNEFYILNGTNLSSISNIAHKDIGSGNETSINGILIRDSLAFFITNSKFEVWNIADIGNIHPWTPNNLVSEFTDLPGGKGTVMDCEGNFIFFASLPSNDKGYITIVKPGL